MSAIAAHNAEQSSYEDTVLLVNLYRRQGKGRQMCHALTHEVHMLPQQDLLRLCSPHTCSAGSPCKPLTDPCQSAPLRILC